MAWVIRYAGSRQGIFRQRMLHRSLDIRVLFRNSRIPAIVPQALTLGHIQVGSYRYRSFAEGLYTL